MAVTYLANAVSPYLYGTGTTPSALVGYVPPSGVPEVPITLNQTFMIELGSVFVPQLGQNGMLISDGWKITFLPSGGPMAKRQFLVSDGFGGNTIPEGYDFFNTVIESGSGVKTNGVFNIAVAGQVSSNVKQMYPSYKKMLLSSRGQYTVETAYFPYSKPDNPSPSRNVNGIQRGSKINFFTQDNFSLFVFELPQDIRTQLNLLPD